MAREPKLGLALSGGGFRASFFHIGVLAQLADLDLLRRVEVISTVSGGSIVGAYYYLKLKKLLETKEDSQIQQSDYQTLVAEMADAFLTAVQRNPRLLTFVNPIKNLRFRRPDYSRSDRLGELLDELLYRPLMGPDRKAPVQMRELIIQPRGENADFHPERHNARRQAKVPILLINATSLNTGRNWRFEAIRMGEPFRLDPITFDIDKRMRLPRPSRYQYLTPRHQGLALGKAVAASAAVPGIFHPLAISGLYEGVRIELVDGGVHDNQGVQGLLDRGCEQLVVSDGSGQMDGVRHPGTSILSVLPRANSILMNRVREEQLQYVARRGGGMDDCLIHLRKGLEPEVIPYFDQKHLLAGAASVSQRGVLPHGTAPEVQWALSRIRTDLDAFHDAEAFALMCNGYQIAGHELKTARRIWERRGTVRPSQWRFLEVAPLLAQPTEAFLKVLRVGGSVVFKLWMLYPGLAVLMGVVTVVLLSGLAWIFRDALARPLIPPQSVPSWFEVLGSCLIVVGIAVAARWRLFQWFRFLRKLVEAGRRPALWVWRLVVRGIIPALGAWPIAAYLKWLNPLYLRAGKLDRLFGQHEPKAPAVSAPGSTRAAGRPG